jgi:hypothetical protein
MLRGCCIVLGFVLAATALGCGERVKERQIEVKTAGDPLFLPKSVLQRYADGQPLGSEVTSFANMVETLRKADAAKADVLQKGLDEIQQSAPEQLPKKAQELLKELEASAGPEPAKP